MQIFVLKRINANICIKTKSMQIFVLKQILMQIFVLKQILMQTFVIKQILMQIFVCIFLIKYLEKATS